MRHRVLITDLDRSTFEVEASMLDPQSVDLHRSPGVDEATLVAEASKADAIVIQYASITEPVIAAAAKGGCLAMVRYGIGYDNVDVAAAELYGIPLANVPDYCLDEVADHTIAMLLAQARQVVTANRSVQAGRWEIPKGEIPRLRGMRLGLLGFGRIGRRVALRALSFGLIVSAYDPVARVDLSDIQSAPTINELVAESDYVSLHMPLTPATHHMINHDMLRGFKRGSVLINTARGGLVDLTAVLWALESGILHGVALDVFETEPLPVDHPLRTHPAALLTPHMSYYSNDAELELGRRVGEEIARGLRGEPLLNAVTKIRVARRRA
jgi:D-3-phosphoglycerate dehydrogenase